jgi:hypothetical protein
MLQMPGISYLPNAPPALKPKSLHPQEALLTIRWSTYGEVKIHIKMRPHTLLATQLASHAVSFVREQPLAFPSAPAQQLAALKMQSGAPGRLILTTVLKSVTVAGHTSDLPKDDHLEVAVQEAFEKGTPHFMIVVGTSKPVY